MWEGRKFFTDGCGFYTTVDDIIVPVGQFFIFILIVFESEETTFLHRKGDFGNRIIVMEKQLDLSILWSTDGVLWIFPPTFLWINTFPLFSKNTREILIK